MHQAYTSPIAFEVPPASEHDLTEEGEVHEDVVEISLPLIGSIPLGPLEGPVLTNVRCDCCCAGDGNLTRGLQQHVELVVGGTTVGHRRAAPPLSLPAHVLTASPTGTNWGMGVTGAPRHDGTP
jgi:hypothetical protein